ncbi:dehydrogenase/reductase SDR family member 7-like [Lutzomyia longipalpis]|uniref:dehydrogenase/reductase SDR family member 7-like n=1 Tax=Lutzomyia longipalpis TaxID=7200 RepID=UPI0024839777|nr:dehydrogenase/reductase SDR family member 7-like [Lutzomyia longipalpis]
MLPMVLTVFGSFGLIILLYYLISVFLWIKLDSNAELYFKLKFGKKISSLAGKVVWITGASSGLGRSLAILLASHGVKLVLSARRVDELKRVRQDCLDAAGGKLQEKDVLALRMDVLDIDKHVELLETIIKNFSRLDILVSNAGRSVRADWVDIDLDVDKAVFDLDVFSPIHLARVVSRYFLKNKIDGHIAVTSSSSSLTPTPNMSSYIAAKSAINAYFHALNMDYPQIKTTIYCIGPFFSEIQEEAFTGRLGEKYGVSLRSINKLERMSAERSAYLFAVAIANEISMDVTVEFI